MLLIIGLTVTAARKNVPEPFMADAIAGYAYLFSFIARILNKLRFSRGVISYMLILLVLMTASASRQGC